MTSLMSASSSMRPCSTKTRSAVRSPVGRHSPTQNRKPKRLEHAELAVVAERPGVSPVHLPGPNERMTGHGDDGSGGRGVQGERPEATSGQDEAKRPGSGPVRADRRDSVLGSCRVTGVLLPSGFIRVRGRVLAKVCDAQLVTKWRVMMPLLSQ